MTLIDIYIDVLLDLVTRHHWLIYVHPVPPVLTRWVHPYECLGWLLPHQETHETVKAHHLDQSATSILTLISPVDQLLTNLHKHNSSHLVALFLFFYFFIFMTNMSIVRYCFHSMYVRNKSLKIG